MLFLRSYYNVSISPDRIKLVYGSRHSRWHRIQLLLWLRSISWPRSCTLWFHDLATPGQATPWILSGYMQPVLMWAQSGCDPGCRPDLAWPLGEQLSWLDHLFRAPPFQRFPMTVKETQLA